MSTCRWETCAECMPVPWRPESVWDPQELELQQLWAAWRGRWEPSASSERTAEDLDRGATSPALQPQRLRQIASAHTLLSPEMRLPWYRDPLYFIRDNMITLPCLRPRGASAGVFSSLWLSEKLILHYTQTFLILPGSWRLINFFCKNILRGLSIGIPAHFVPTQVKMYFICLEGQSKVPFAPGRWNLKGMREHLCLQDFAHNT